jgi:hypothetical protein
MSINVIWYRYFVGSEGKLSVTSHRQSVLSAIGNLTLSPVSGASVIENLVVEIGELFIPFLKQEGK